MTKTPKVLVGITAGLALLVGPTAVYAGNQKAKKVKEKGKGDLTIAQSKSKSKTKNVTRCDSTASGLVAIPVSACDVLDLELTDTLNDSLNGLLKNLLAGGLL